MNTITNIFKRLDTNDGKFKGFNELVHENQEKISQNQVEHLCNSMTDKKHVIWIIFFFLFVLIVALIQILHKSTNVLNYLCDNIFKHLTFTLIGGNEENISVVRWMRLNGLEIQMNKTSLQHPPYTCS